FPPYSVIVSTVRGSRFIFSGLHDRIIGRSRETEGTGMTDFAHYEHLVPDVFLFVDRRCFPDWGIARRPIDFHDLTFVVGGQADYYLDGVKYTVEAGDLLYAPPGTIREANTCADSPMHSYAFNF